MGSFPPAGERYHVSYSDARAESFFPGEGWSLKPCVPASTRGASRQGMRGNQGRVLTGDPGKPILDR